MTNYVKTTNFLRKDSLPDDSTEKVIRGSEFDTEFNNLVISSASKANLISPVLTGVPTAPTANVGANNAQIATTEFVTTSTGNALGTLGTISTQDADAVAITGGTITGITDLTVADGGTGVSELTGVVVGKGTDPVVAIAPGEAGNSLVSDGTDWVAEKAPGITETTGDLPYYGARGFGWFMADAPNVVGAGSQNFGSVSETSPPGAMNNSFRITFATALPNANYAVIAQGENQPNEVQVGTQITATRNQTTTGFEIVCEPRESNFNPNEVKISWVVFQ